MTLHNSVRGLLQHGLGPECLGHVEETQGSEELLRQPEKPCDVKLALENLIHVLGRPLRVRVGSHQRIDVLPLLGPHVACWKQIGGQRDTWGSQTECRCDTCNRQIKNR